MGIDKQISRQYINEGLKGWKKYLPLINITLFIGAITLGVIGGVLFHAVPSPLTGLERLKTKIPPQQVSVPAIQTNTTPQEGYDLVANENPFAPGRKEWEPPPPKVGYDAQKQGEIKGPPKVPPRKVALYGIAITENLKKALVRNPNPMPGASPFLYVEEGNDIGGYKVKSIEPNLIRLIWEGEESVVNIFADKDNVRTLPPPPLQPPSPPQPPRPEGRGRPPHEMEVPSRRQPQTRQEEEAIEEDEDWDEEEEGETLTEEEGGEELTEGEGEGYERMGAAPRFHQPKRPGRRPRGR